MAMPPQCRTEESKSKIRGQDGYPRGKLVNRTCERKEERMSGEGGRYM